MLIYRQMLEAARENWAKAQAAKAERVAALTVNLNTTEGMQAEAAIEAQVGYWECLDNLRYWEALNA